MVAVISPFVRPAPATGAIPLFSTEGDRLARFRPPFRFTSFFAPEDTLLCVLAAEAALALARRRALDGRGGVRVVELTAGSGLVGFRLLDADPTAVLVGVDVDPEAPAVAEANAAALGHTRRARFLRASLWDEGLSDALAGALAGARVDVLVCNPPYVPEPPSTLLPVEAGAGADGTAHLRRVLELAARMRPSALALSFCSLSDPAGVVAAAQRAGYALDALYVVAIADGEYSGAVRDYLRRLPTAYLAESPGAVASVAPDGAARFAYLLMAGVFVTSRERELGSGARATVGAAVQHFVEDFTARGLAALEQPGLPCLTSCWLLDRWDEIALRAIVHGPVGPGHRHVPAPRPPRPGRP